MLPLRIVLCWGLISGASSAAAQNCAETSVGFVPLHDLADGSYRGFQGGLYPEGELVRPALHDAAGLVQSARVIPRDGFGNPDPEGAIVFLSIGLSNTTQEFQEFLSLTQDDDTLNPRLVIVDGAQGGQAAEDILSLNAPYWSYVDEQLAEAGVTVDQVQVIWLKTANRAPTHAFPGWAQTFQGHMTVIARNIQTRFPFARLAYVSSRIYAGYATTNLNPEPYAYESGFAVKWLIQDQIEGNPALGFDPTHGPRESRSRKCSTTSSARTGRPRPGTWPTHVRSALNRRARPSSVSRQVAPAAPYNSSPAPRPPSPPPTRFARTPSEPPRWPWASSSSLELRPDPEGPSAGW